MVEFNVCVACLATDIKMHSVRYTLFHEIYENLANVKLSADGIPETLCYICYSQLVRCHRFMSMSRRAAEILVQLHQDGIQLSQDSVPSLNDRFTNIVTTVLKPTFIPHDEFVEETVNTPFANVVTTGMDKRSSIGEIISTINENTQSQVLNLTQNENENSFSLKAEFMDEEMTIEEGFVSVKEEHVDREVKSTTAKELSLVKQENAVIKREDFITKEVKMGAPKNNTAKKNKLLSKAGSKYTKPKNSNKNTNFTEKTHACTRCERQFSCKAHLSRHLRIHTGEKPFVCKICNKTFAQSSHLVQHIRLHTGEKPYSCHLCKNKAFNHRYNYETHMRKHFGMPTHTCNLCSSAFHQKSDLKRHVMTHTGEKPYTCDTCHTKFSQRCHLTKHERIHSREKPYACTYCEASFAQKNDLVNHLKIHNGERPFPCTYQGCSKKFRRKGTLANHLRVHTEERPFACDKCDKSFKQKAHLRKHTNLVHVNIIDSQANEIFLKLDPDIQHNQDGLQINYHYLQNHEEEYIIP